MAEWKPYAARFSPPPLSAKSDASGVERVICVECQASFAESDVVRIGDVSLCAACKPIHLQHILSGGRAGVRNGGVAPPKSPHHGPQYKSPGPVLEM